MITERDEGELVVVYIYALSGRCSGESEEYHAA
jgi:hypothetical protein